MSEIDDLLKKFKQLFIKKSIVNEIDCTEFSISSHVKITVGRMCSNKVIDVFIV